MSGPFVEYVWVAYGLTALVLGLTIAVTLAAYRNARRAVQDSETKP